MVIAILPDRSSSAVPLFDDPRSDHGLVSNLAAAVVYPLALHVGAPPRWLVVGPAPLIETAVPYSDERTDRGRALPPHVTDVVFGQRWHTRADPARGPELARVMADWADHGLDLRWIEIIRFIGERESSTLASIAGGRYPELLDGLAVLHFDVVGDGHEQVRRFVSRGAQDLHGQVRELLSPFGDVRRETPERLMDPSELPFLVVSAVDDEAQDAATAAVGLVGRSPESARTARVDGWDLSVWPDACAISARGSTDDAFRLARRETWVAMSVMLDGILIRFAQLQALSMLARRVADGAAAEDGQARKLHGASLRIRSRVWWPTVSSTPYVEELAGVLAAQWGLEQLSDTVFDDVDGLAQHAELVATERLNRLVFVLTAGALGIAAVSLIVQVVTSDRLAVGAVAAALAALTCGLVALIGGRARRR